MISKKNDRMSGVLKTRSSNGTPRSRAQRQASRINGARSKGPLSAAGKAISRANSWRHGLLARKIAPPGDSRADDRLYKEVLDELTEEFDPATYTEFAEVTALASNMVQFVRAGQMLEALQRPAPLAKNTEEKLKAFKRNQRDVKLLNQAIAGLKAGEAPDFEQEQAARLADLVALWIEGQQSDVAEAKQEDADGHLDAEGHAEMESEAASLEAIGPAKERFSDRQYLSETLSGLKPLITGDDKRLLVPLEPMVAWRQVAIDPNDDIEARVERIKDEVLLRLAKSPDPLMLILRYKTRLERTVNKTVKEFRRRRTSKTGKTR